MNNIITFRVTKEESILTPRAMRRPIFAPHSPVGSLSAFAAGSQMSTFTTIAERRVTK